MKAIKVPKRYKKDIRDQLFELGIHQGSIFGELDGQSDFIKQQWTTFFKPLPAKPKDKLQTDDIGSFNKLQMDSVNSKLEKLTLSPTLPAEKLLESTERLRKLSPESLDLKAWKQRRKLPHRVPKSNEQWI